MQQAPDGAGGRLGAASSGWLVAAQVVYMGLGYLLTVGLARVLGVADFGLYALAITIVTWVAIVAATGVPQVAAAHLAAGGEDVEPVWRAAVRLQILLTCALAALLMIIAPLLALVLDQSGLGAAIALGALAMPGVGILSLQLGRLAAGLAFRRQAAAQIAWHVARTGGALAAAAVGGLRAALVAIAIAALPGLAIAGRAGLPAGPRAPLGGLLRAAMGASLAALLVLVLGGYDLLAVSRLLPEATGPYAAAQNLARIPLLLAVPLAAAILPHAARRAHGDRRLPRLLELALLATLASAAAIAVDPAGILRLVFGAGYAEAGAGAVVVLLAGAFAVLGCVSAIVAVLVGVGHRRRAVSAILPGLAIGLVLVVPLVDRLDAPGAALSVLVGSLVALAAGAAALRGSAPGLMAEVRIGRVAVAAAAAGGLGLAVPGPAPLAAVVVGVSALAVARLLDLPPLARRVV